MEATKQETIRLIRSAARTHKSQRIPLYRKAAANLVELRRLFYTPDGRTDWRGQSWPYRSLLNEIYSAAGLPPDSNHPVKAALRYHVNQLLREVVDADELQAAGLLVAPPRQRQTDRHREQSALAERARSLVLRIQRGHFQGDEHDLQDAQQIMELLGTWVRQREHAL
jgi:hypothetical protein